MSSDLFGVPSVEGVDVSGVFYRYTANKQQNDPYTVSIQNQDTLNGGYIFRETDDWSGGSGGTIQKFVPVPYSPLGRWGDGEIEQVGIGSVTDPTVIYMYRRDPDAYQPVMPDLPEIEIYDPLSDRYVMNATQPTDLSMIERDEEPEADKDEEDDEKRLEVALTAAENAITIATGVSQTSMIQAMNRSVNVSAYLAREIPGGEYREAIVLKDKKISDNARAFRSLSRDKLHTEMVNQQYR